MEEKINKLGERITANETDMRHTINQVRTIFGKIDDIRAEMARMPEHVREMLREVIKDHEKWEEKKHEEAKSIHDKCEADRKQMNDKITKLQMSKMILMAMITGAGIVFATIFEVVKFLISFIK